ncbi:MAG: helix-turn-helix domain-containing protein [Solirubrobacterales bacterium]
MTTGEHLLTTRRAAELLNVTPRTVTNWIRADRVPYVRLPGGEYRLPLDGLLDSLSGTYDVRTPIEGALELDQAARLRAAAAMELSMPERLARVHRLSRQLTAIAGVARS